MRKVLLTLAMSILAFLPISSSSGGIRTINNTSSFDTYLSLQDTSKKDELTEIITQAVSRKRELQRELRSFIYKTYTKSVSAVKNSRVDVTQDITLLYEYHAIYRHAQKRVRSKNCGFRCAGSTGLLWDPGLLTVFLNDTIETGKSHVITPLGENTLDYYQYRLLGTVTMSGHKVYELLVIPVKKNVPLIDGTLFIAKDDYSIAGYEFTFNDATKLPGRVDKLTIKQEFVLFYGKYWLPVRQQAIGYFIMTIPFEDNFIRAVKYPGKSEHNITVYDYRIIIGTSQKTYVNDFKELRENAKNRNSDYWIPIAGELSRIERHAFVSLRTYYRNLRDIQSRLK